MEHIQFVMEYEEGAAHECDRVPAVLPSQNSRHIASQQNFFGCALDEHKEDQGKDKRFKFIKTVLNGVRDPGK